MFTLCYTVVYTEMYSIVGSTITMRFKSDHLPVLISFKIRDICHFVLYLMYITGAKFEDHYSNIFDFVIYYSNLYSLWRHQFLNKNLNYISEMREDIPKQKTPFFFERSLR